MDEKMTALIAAVRAHARAHYEEGGWDYVVEAFDDEDLAADIGRATTPEDAIAAVQEVLQLLDDRRQDIQATVF